MLNYQSIIDKIRQIYHKPEGQIILHEPLFVGNEKKYLEDCINSTYVSSVGKYVELFEEKMAEYTGATNAVACVNGTNALHIALMLVGVDRGTEVITQPLTFIATANAISYCGAIPIFLDVDMDTLGLSPKALKDWLEENSKLKTRNSKPINKKTGRQISAIVPMHTFGHPCLVDEIVEICNQYHIPVIEDAAESLGSYYKGHHTGTFGEIGVLSFNGNKTITTGGGGMLLFKDEELAKRAKHLTTQAKVPHPWEFIHDSIGYNYRMPNINAALGLAQLEKLQMFLESKRIVAKAYELFFSTLTTTFIAEPPNSLSNYWLNCILFKDKLERDAFLKYSNDNGVMTRPAWKLVNEHSMFKDCQSDELPNSRELCNRLVSIPSNAILGIL